MMSSFTKGLEYLNIHSYKIIDGKGPLDMFLHNCEHKQQYFVYKGNNIIRPPDRDEEY